MGDSIATQQTKRLPRKVAAGCFYDLQSLKRYKVDQNQKQQQRSQDPGSFIIPAFQPLHAPFQTFKTQQAAFDFLDQQPCASILRTFACETSTTGQRDFLVTSAERFWKHYSQLPEKQRHHYEIIRQNTPCNLYFDLEFCPQSNPGLDGASLVSLLLSGVSQQLQALYDIPWHPSFVLELDSSTEAKFSRHLIIRLPHMAFADACHAGRFARLVLLSLLLKAQHCSALSQLLVASKDGGLTSFVDMGVYTRNRAFRLMLSSKYGKTAVLRLTHRFGGRGRCPKAAFYDCLVSVLPGHKQGNSAPVAAAERGSRHSSSNRWGWLSLLHVDQDGQQELQQLPEAWKQVAMLQLRPLEHIQQHNLKPTTEAAAVAARGGSSAQPSYLPHAPGAASPAAQPCYGPSPFPKLEEFVVSVCSMGGVQGGVRSWLLQPGTCCVVYNMKNNRWCGNIGRAHKSNGIYYCVDLSAGVYWQKCYDPECRQYRSNWLPLPASIWEAYRMHPDNHHQQQQQPQQPQEPAQQDNDDDDDDEACLQLIMQCEQQQQQHVQGQEIAPGNGSRRQHAAIADGTSSGSQDRAFLVCSAAAGSGEHQADVSQAGSNEDDLLLKLLQDVEMSMAEQQTG